MYAAYSGIQAVCMCLQDNNCNESIHNLLINVNIYSGEVFFSSSWIFSNVSGPTNAKRATLFSWSNFTIVYSIYSIKACLRHNLLVPGPRWTGSGGEASRQVPRLQTSVDRWCDP